METKKVRYHIIFIALLILIGFLNIKEFWVYNEIPVLDTFSGYYPRARILREFMYL